MTAELLTTVFLWVDNVDYGYFASEAEAYSWLDENFPDWGDRDVDLDTSMEN